MQDFGSFQIFKIFVPDLYAKVMAFLKIQNKSESCKKNIKHVTT